MKIIHVSSANTWRGGEQQIFYLYEGLFEYADQYIVAVEGSRMAFECKLRSRNVKTFEKGAALSLRFARNLAEFAEEFEADLVHAHDSHAHNFCLLASFIYGMPQPIVLHRRVDYPVSNNLFSRFKYNTSRVKRIICVSHEVKRVLSESLKDESRAVVIHSGVDLKKFEHANRDTLRNLLGRAREDILIGNVAAITQQKDYFTFVDAAEIIHKKNQRVHFVVMGDGDQRDEIEEYAKAKGLKAHFSFLGFRNDINRLLPGLDILLFSSEKEGLGTTLMDAQVAGVPIVATNAGGIPEILENGANALLAGVKDAEALAAKSLELIENPQLREALVQEGLERAKEYDKLSMAKAIFRVYLAVLKEQ